jgi:hypothetical protein
VADGVQRVADRDLVADHEDGLERLLEQPAESVCVTMGGLVEALAPRKTVGPRVLVLPGVVLVDGLPFELADADVVELRVLDERNVAALRRDPRGLERPPKPRVQDPVECEAAQLQPEEPRLLAAELGQRRREVGVAVDPVLVVERRLRVPAEDVERDRGRLRGRTAAPNTFA